MSLKRDREVFDASLASPGSDHLMAEAALELEDGWVAERVLVLVHRQDRAVLGRGERRAGARHARLVVSERVEVLERGGVIDSGLYGSALSNWKQ